MCDLYNCQIYKGVVALLLDLLVEDTIEICSEAKNWEEAGKIAGQLLVDKDKIEKRYIEAMIESVKKFGPYIVIAPGIALFHARPEDGVKSMCMSLAVFKKGVTFNAGKKDPVKLVFVLGALDNESHLKVLAETMTLLQDSNVINGIISSDSQGEVLKIIKNKLLSY